MREALKVLNGALSGPNGPRVEYREHPLGADYYERTGEILPDELIEECKKSDAVLLSAIGLPDIRLPDGTEVQPHQVVDPNSMTSRLCSGNDVGRCLKDDTPLIR